MDPRSDWRTLCGRYPLISAQGPTLARELAPNPGLLQLTEPATGFLPEIAGVFPEAQADLPAGEIWEPERVERVAARVAGLGAGLTPSADDWLAGLGRLVGFATL